MIWLTLLALVLVSGWAVVSVYRMGKGGTASYVDLFLLFAIVIFDLLGDLLVRIAGGRA